MHGLAGGVCLSRAVSSCWAPGRRLQVFGCVLEARVSCAGLQGGVIWGCQNWGLVGAHLLDELFHQKAVQVLAEVRWMDIQVLLEDDCVESHGAEGASGARARWAVAPSALVCCASRTSQHNSLSACGPRMCC